MQLGGWWRITAKYNSDQEESAVDVSRKVGKAIDNKWSSSAGGGGKGAGIVPSGPYTSGGLLGVAPKLSGSYSYGDENDHLNATKNLSSKTKAATNIEVFQTWKGGLSGGTPTEWRQSLSEEVN